MIGMKRSPFTEATPMDSVMGLRLDRARQLLGTTALSVTEVATGFGFIDRSDLSRAFRVRFEVSPAKLRRQGDA